MVDYSDKMKEICIMHELLEDFVVYYKKGHGYKISSFVDELCKVAEEMEYDVTDFVSSFGAEEHHEVTIDGRRLEFLPEDKAIGEDYYLLTF